MVEKKGQFTLFVIIGIIFVATMLFALFMRGYFFQQKLLLEAETNVKEALKINNVDFYVESCLDRISEDAVYLISLQGGRIYAFQCGLWSDPDPLYQGLNFVNMNLSQSYINISFYNSSNVSYAILPNYNNTCIVTSPPGYPFFNASAKMLKVIYHNNSIQLKSCSFDTGVIGANSLPKLCDVNGSNKMNSTGGNYSFFHGICTFGYGSMSIQEQLERYTEKKLRDCVDLSIFENLGSNITVVGNVSVDYTFVDNHFVVKANYPLDIRIRGKNVKTIAEFEKKKELRFKRTYEFLQRILEQEYKNIFFDIENDYKNYSLGWDYGLKLIRVPNLCEDCGVGKYDDLFQLIDNATIIRGHPLIFNFMVKNRVPVLDYIHSGQKYNIVVKEGDEIFIQPIGLDPDETLLKYYYTGWKENYTATFNETGCILDIVSCEENPALFVIKDYSIQPHNWTNSTPYNNTKVNASYITNRSDLGLHHTTIWIEDEEKLIDFQNVSIMVFDVPLVIPSGSNNYTDISNHNASIEDPYTLDAYTTSIFTNVFKFYWRDLIDPFHIETSIPTIFIPDPVDINTITEHEFVKTDPRNVQVQGEYYYLQGTELTPWASWYVDVHQCLPHRSTGAMYPYNEISGNGAFNPYDNSPNPFLSNHGCCDNETYWGKVTTGNNCYDYNEWSSWFLFNDTKDKFITGEFEAINPNKFASSYLQNEWYAQSFTPLTQNDIWFRSFSRSCDGTRGNMCNGTANMQLQNSVPCNDKLAGEEETCSGPNPLLKTQFKPTLQTCYNYPLGQTFEKVFRDGTGSCNHQEKCSGSNFGDNKYDTSGPKLCNATCDGSGGCDGTTSNNCYDCRKKDVIPTGAAYNLMQIENCVGGEAGVCSNDACRTNPTTNCFEECIMQGLRYKFKECYASNMNSYGVEESCTSILVEPDNYKEICTNVACNFEWTGQGGELNCCLDDLNECEDNNNCYKDGDSTVIGGILMYCQGDDFWSPMP